MSHTMMPFVSVIMPIRNEAAYIKHSLGRVLAQDYPHDRMEVLIADGMSTDETRMLVRELGGSSDVAVSILDNRKQIAPSGMNVGIRAARGDVIVRVDGHCLIPTDYVRRCVELLVARPDVDCVGGAVESVGEGLVGRAISLAMSSTFGVGDSRFRTASEDLDPVETDTVPFGAFRREVFERIGLFNEDMVRHQDYEFNYRLRKSGGTILLIPDLRATYYVRSGLWALWRQYWQYGVWKGRFLRTHPASVRLRHLIPPAFVFGLIVNAILAVLTPFGAWPLVGLVGAYLAAAVMATIHATWHERAAAAFVLPAIFACLHVSWGSGVWLGLLSGGAAREDRKAGQGGGRLTPRRQGGGMAESVSD